MPGSDLLHSQPDRWERATRHPFLLAVRDGSLPGEAFDTWLVQDFHFVGDLLRFQARLLARAPRPVQAVLAGGVGALVEELSWFEGLALARGLDLGGARLPATEGYAALLERLDRADVGEALAALWAVEQVYLDAWTAAAPGAPEYAEFVAHWTTPAFRAYVAALQQAAEEVAGGADVLPVVGEVLAAEEAFWDMARNAAGREQAP